jgi:hypothetical protein
MGPDNRTRGRMNVQRLYDYVSKVMPFDAPGSLKPEEYWAILAYITRTNGYLPPGTELGPSNAAQIDISK